MNFLIICVSVPIFMFLIPILVGLLNAKDELEFKEIYVETAKDVSGFRILEDSYDSESFKGGLFSEPNWTKYENIKTGKIASKKYIEKYGRAGKSEIDWS